MFNSRALPVDSGFVPPSGVTQLTAPQVLPRVLWRGVLRGLTGLVVVGLLSACAGRGNDAPPNPGLDSIADGASGAEQQIYQAAQKSLRANNFSAAIQHLGQLEARFPFGRYAEQAQLELIFARFMSLELSAAQSAANRFIRLHPQHENVDYAHYISGLAAYKRNASILDRISSADPARRDTSAAKEAFNIFNDLLQRYPNSEYAPDARQRMLYLRELLARSEINIASYYLNRNAYVAAANRANYVIENFPSCDAVADALAIGIEANWRLGLNANANDQLRVLALNFPDYNAFDDAGNLVFAKTITNRDRSWLNVVTLGLIDRPAVPPPLRIVNESGSTVAIGE